MPRVKTQKPKPETEVALFELQALYLDKRELSVYQRMFTVLMPYVRSMILKETTGKIYLPPELVDNATLEATVKFMQKYEKPHFKIDDSFAGMVRYSVLESLYAPKVRRNDQIGSLNEHIENGKTTNTELGDLQESFGFTYLWQPANSEYSDPLYHLANKSDEAINSVLSVLTDIYEASDLHTYFLVSFGVIKFIKKSKSYEDYVCKFLSDKQKEILDLGIMEIGKRLREAS